MTEHFVATAETEATVTYAGVHIFFPQAGAPVNRTFLALEDAIIVAKAILSFAAEHNIDSTTNNAQESNHVD